MTIVSTVLKTTASNELNEQVQKELKKEDPEVSVAHEVVYGSGVTNDKQNS